MTRQRDQVRAHPVLLALAAGASLGLLVAGIVWGLQGGERSLASGLRAHGVRTQGVVTVTDPAGQGAGAYRYVVAGHAFQGGLSAEGSQGRAGGLAVGERIDVVYDARNPALSCACDVSALTTASDWWRTLLAALALAGVLAVLIGFGVARGPRPAPAAWEPVPALD